MKQDEEETKVIFKIARYEDGEKEVVAFFPGMPAKPGRVFCYSHNSQHDEAGYEFYAMNCENCSDAQYADLKKELESLFGYRLKIVKRITRKDIEKAWKRIG